MTRFSPDSVVLFVTGMWMFLSFSAAAQELPFTHYTSDHPVTPLPANGVVAIYQDGIGFLWIALSGAGVVRYDGRVMEHVTMEEGLVDPNVDGFVQSADGHLWIPSYGGLSVSTRPLQEVPSYESVRFTTSYCGTEVYGGSITGNAVAADAQDGVWVGTADQGVVRYRCTDGAAQVDTFQTTVEGAVEEVYALTLRRDGSLWAALSGGRMLRLDRALDASHDDRFTLVSSEKVTATTTALFEDSQGTLWGGTYDGQIWHHKHGEWTVIEPSLGHWIFSIAETSDGVVWVGSSGGGLLRIGPEGTRRLSRRHGLLSETVYGLGTDREGNLYVGQSQGLSKLPSDYRAFEHFTATAHGSTPPVLPAGSVTAVLSGDERLWISTVGGLVAVTQGGTIQQVQAADGLPTNELYALGQDAEGVLWIGLNGPTTALHPATLRPSTIGPTETASFMLNGAAWQATSLRLFNVYAIRNLDLRTSASDSSKTPSTWFASFMKVACLVEGEWFTFRQDAGFPATASGGAVVDEAGHVWIATDDQGLYRSRTPLYADSLRALHRRHPGDGDAGREIATPVFEPAWTMDTGAPTDAIQTLAWHGGHLWIGTPAGLFVAEPSLTNVHAVQGLPDRSIVAFAASKQDGGMWVGTKRGLAEVDPATLAVGRTLGATDGLLNEEPSFINSVATGRDGAVYFGSAKGLTVYRPHLDRTNEHPPKVVLRRVAYEDQAWGRNRFEAEFAALTFTREQAVRYQTRFVGYDGWSEATPEQHVVMTNLPALLVPRTYTLEVRARNGDGVWSEAPLRYAFTVQPAWFASWWFVLAALGVVAGGSYVAYRRHLRRERFRQEVQSARAIQQKLQPTRPLRTSAFEVAGICVPAYEVGGDHFDYRWIEPERWALVLLVDVEGKRMEGAFQAAIVRGMIATLADLSDPRHLADAVARLNGLIYDALAAETAVAAIIGVLDVEVGCVTLVNAGCEPPLVVRASEVHWVDQAVACPPLGKVRSARYRSFTVQFEPGDSLILCSDGVTEARGSNGGYYRSRLGEGLVRQDSGSAEAMARHLLQDVAAFTEGARPADDRTIVVLRRYEPASAASASSVVA